MKKRLFSLLWAILFLSCLAAPGTASGEASGGAPSAEDAQPVTFESADGSRLELWPDGTCAYTTEVSGRVNDMPMRDQLTFHGTLENGAFSFDRVTWHGLDLTEIARNAGFTDASHWERQAAALYAAAASGEPSGGAC